MHHAKRSKCVANFIFSTITTSQVKLERWRLNHRNLSVNIPNNLPRKCQLSAKIEAMTSRHTGRFGLHPVDPWVIRLPTSMKLTGDWSAPGRAEFYLSRPLLASTTRTLFPSNIAQSDTNWEDIYCTFAILWDTGVYICVKASLPGNTCDWQLLLSLWIT